MIRNLRKGIRGNWLILSLTALLCLLLLFSLAAELRPVEHGVDELLAFRIQTDDTRLPVRCWLNDDTCTVFLPSYASLARTTAVIAGGERILLDGKVLSDGMSCGSFALGTEYVLLVGERAPLRFRFLKSENIASMFLSTRSGSMDELHQDKTHRENADIVLLSADGVLDYHTPYTDQIRGHGNSTWELEKKSYNLYLGLDAPLLGLPAAGKFVLISNAIDDTCMRNRLIYDFAASLGSYPGFSPGCEYVDLYLNGDYAGLYLLCEKPDVSSLSRSLSPERFLFELTAYGSVEDRRCFVQNEGVFIEIHAPDPCTDVEKAALETRLQTFQSSLLSSGHSGIAASDDTWLDVIDLDSWARKYLIEEVFENADAGFYSQYFFWDRSSDRIFAGPCWDYDGAIGMFEHFPNCFLAQRFWLNAGHYSPWYGTLCQKDVFRARVMELYRSEFAPALDRLIQTTIPALAGRLETALELNRIRWYDAIDDVSVSIAEMTDYLERRIAFLNSAWLDGIEYHTITLRRTPGAVFLYYCIADGEPCSSLPTPEDLGADSSVWYVEHSGRAFDPETVITGDLVLTAYSPAAAD